MLKTIQGWWRREEGAQQKPELTLAITKLMVGMMSMDGKLDDDEHAEIVNMLGEQFNIAAEESTNLIEQAKDTSRSDLSMNKVVEQIVKYYEVDERVAILAKLWRVAMADGNIAFLEEQYINRISVLIGVSSDALTELKEKQGKAFPDLDQSDRFHHPDPVND
ncbi:MAG: TerB family tellurite resistance protein [Mariprofundaceae bacterium]